MTRDEGVALIQEQMAFRTTLSANIVTYMKLAQKTLERGPTKPWFLISEDTFATTDVDEERLAVPTNFIQEVDQASLRYRPDDWPDSPEVELKKDEYDVLKRNFKHASSGPPKAYALMGEYIRLFPTPDDAYTLRWIIYEDDTVLDANVENKWLREVPLLLLGTAGKLMVGATRDPGAKATFDEWIQVGLKVVHTHDVSREMQNMVMQMGGPAV